MSTSYATALGKTLLRNGYLVAACLVLLGLFAYPAFRPIGTGGIYITPEVYASQLYSNQDLMARPEFKEHATPEHVNRLTEENELLEQVTRAATEEDLLRSVAAYEKYHREHLGVGGGIIAEADRIGISANSLAIELVANLEHPAIYNSTLETPLLLYALFTLHAVPYILWLVPLAIIVYACAKSRSGDGLFALAPISRPMEFCSIALLTFGMTAATVLVACLPGLIVTAINNGIGDPNYPVVYIKTGEIICTTVGSSLLQYAALYGLSILFLSVLSALLIMITNSALASQVILLMCVATPLAPGYYGDGQTPVSAMRSWLPTTYFDPCRTVGYPTFANGMTVNEIAQCTFERGVAALGLCLALTVILAALFFGGASLARRFTAKGGEHAFRSQP